MKMAKWSDAELEFLSAHYSEHGPTWIAKQLNRGIFGVKERASRSGVSFDRSAEATYRRALVAIRADIAAHGQLDYTRIADSSALARTTIAKALCEARKRGDLPPSPRAARMIELARERANWGIEDCDEPSPEQIAIIERRIARAHDRKVRRGEVPQSWSVPTVTCLFKRN